MGDRLVFLRRQITELVVGGGAGLLHHAEGADQVGVVIDADARDVEVVERALGLDAVVAGGRDLHLAQAVMLAAGGGGAGNRLLGDGGVAAVADGVGGGAVLPDRKSTSLNSSH